MRRRLTRRAAPTDAGADEGTGSQAGEPADRLAAALGELTTPGSGARTRELSREVAALVARRARTAGAGAVASGRFLGDLLVEAVAHLPVRDLATLREHHHGLQGEALADALERNAARLTAVLGAAVGTAAAAQWFAGPTLVAVPLEILVETLVVAVVEVKLLAELQAVYGMPVPSGGARHALATALAWAQRRGVNPLLPHTLPATLTAAEALARATIGRRMMGRYARSLGGLAPLLIGAVYGARSNSRHTRALGTAVRRDLRVRRAQSGWSALGA